jgi:hypothetical protein
VTDVAGNERLGALLREAGWTPGELAREINRTVEPGTVHRSTPNLWLRRGSVPDAFVCDVVSTLLSERLRRPVRVGDIWPGAPDGPGPQPVREAPWTRPGLAGVLEWTARWRGDARSEPPLMSGPQSAELVRRYESADVERWRAALDGRHGPDDALVTHIESMIPALRRLDDEQAGEPQLLYVSGQVRIVARLLVRHLNGSAVSRRLLVCLADLAQLEGWMAFELGRHGHAQASFLLGLRAAHAAGDRPLAGHVLGDLCFQAASRGRADEAVAYAEAAERAVTRARGRSRASVLGRVAFGYACAGDTERLLAGHRAAVEAFAGSGARAEWAYYLTEQHLRVQGGYSLVTAAAVRGGNNRRLLRDGLSLMGDAGALGYGGGPPNPRKAGYELAWRGLADVLGGDVEAAGGACVRALDHYRTAPTDRTRRVLGELRRRLGPRARHNRYARELLPRLDAALLAGPAAR